MRIISFITFFSDRHHCSAFFLQFNFHKNEWRKISTSSSSHKSPMHFQVVEKNSRSLSCLFSALRCLFSYAFCWFLFTCGMLWRKKKLNGTLLNFIINIHIEERFPSLVRCFLFNFLVEINNFLLVESFPPTEERWWMSRRDKYQLFWCFKMKNFFLIAFFSVFYEIFILFKSWDLGKNFSRHKICLSNFHSLYFVVLLTQSSY